MSPERIPFAPLEERLRANNLLWPNNRNAMSEGANWSGSSVKVWRERGITIDKADDICSRVLGCHLSEVYPPELYEAVS